MAMGLTREVKTAGPWRVHTHPHLREQLSQSQALPALLECNPSVIRSLDLSEVESWVFM